MPCWRCEPPPQACEDENLAFHRQHWDWSIFHGKCQSFSNTTRLAEPVDDDSSVRIILTFAGDRTKFSAKNANLSELTTLLLGESFPLATLGYL